MIKRDKTGLFKDSLFFCFSTEDPYPSSSIDLKCKERVTDSDSENGSGDESDRKVTNKRNTFSPITHLQYILNTLICLFKVFCHRSFLNDPILFSVFFREFLLQLFAPLHYHLPHNIPHMAGVFRCPLTHPVNVTMTGDRVEEGFQIIGGRKEEKGRVRTHLRVKNVVDCKLPLFPSLLDSQSSPLHQLE